MTIDETKMILGILKTAYPNFYKEMSKQEMLNVVDLWADMFKNDNSKLVTVAVKELINSFQYPPTIADVKNKMYSLTSNDKTPSELWESLQKAISNGIYHSEEEFSKLPDECKEFIRNPNQLRELAMTDSDVIHTVTKGQFLKQIQIIQDRIIEKKKMLPQNKEILSIIGNIGQDVSGLLGVKNE